MVQGVGLSIEGLSLRVRQTSRLETPVILLFVYVIRYRTTAVQDEKTRFEVSVMMAPLFHYPLEEHVLMCPPARALLLVFRGVRTCLEVHRLLDMIDDRHHWKGRVDAYEICTRC